MFRFAEFKELRKQWRLAKKEQEEISRDRARMAQMEREQEEQRRAEAYGMPMSLSSVPGVVSQLPSGLPMPAHGMRSELVNVGIPIDPTMGANLNQNLQASMGVSVGGLSGSMGGPILSPGSLSVAFSPNAMGGHGLVGPGQNLGTAYAAPPPFGHPRVASSYEFPPQHGQQQTLHPHAHAQAQIDTPRHHRASFDADAHGHRYEYEQRRASFDHGHLQAARGSYDKAAFDQGHRVGGNYVDMQQMNFIYRRRGSQPYPSPHSITHSPLAPTHPHSQQAATSPRSTYSTHSAAGLVYPEDEYAEGYDYRERQQQQQPQSPVEERYQAEAEYYINRAQHHENRSWDLPSLAQPQPHSMPLAQQTHGHLVGPGLVAVEETTTPSTDNGVVESSDVGAEGEPLLTSQGHVSLGSNRLPPNSTLLTPLPNFRGYEQQQEQWERDESGDVDERRRAV